MKVGFLHLNVYSVPSALMVPHPTPPGLFDPAEGQRSLDEGLAQVRLADDIGFDFISLSEHHRMPLVPTPNTTVLGGALSQILKKAELYLLGPIVSYNNPIRIAEEIAMLDQLMRGRLTVALLRGGGEELHTYSNVDPAKSRAITTEGALLIQRALTATEVFDHEGEFFKFKKVSVWPSATQKPTPRIYMSGGSEDSARFAAQHRFPMAIGFYPPHLVAKLTTYYREECAKAGWTPQPEDILYRAFCTIGETVEQAADRKARFYAPTMVPAEQPKEVGTDADGKVHKDADKGAGGFGLGFLQFNGTPDQVYEQISSFAKETGVGVFDLGFVGGGLPHAETISMIQLFGKQVLPRLKR
jgi:alkanesulfonate monooxygenase SsuD/methylene tetrahydromethanopterin reductase-like flavin-dependent oxidoreductase (luciferase family)